MTKGAQMEKNDELRFNTMMGSLKNQVSAALNSIAFLEGEVAVLKAEKAELETKLEQFTLDNKEPSA